MVEVEEFKRGFNVTTSVDHFCNKTLDHPIGQVIVLHTFFLYVRCGIHMALHVNENYWWIYFQRGLTQKRLLLPENMYSSIYYSSGTNSNIFFYQHVRVSSSIIPCCFATFFLSLPCFIPFEPVTLCFHSILFYFFTLLFFWLSFLVTPTTGLRVSLGGQGFYWIVKTPFTLKARTTTTTTTITTTRTMLRTTLTTTSL